MRPPASKRVSRQVVAIDRRSATEPIKGPRLGSLNSSIKRAMSKDKDIYPYPRLGTLCDEPNGLTCSFDAAKRWGRAQTISACPSFEDAAERVKRGELSAFLVPAAYPGLNRLIMDSRLVAAETFILPIPDLVLVGRDETAPERVEVLFHHPATTALLPETGIAYRDTRHSTSNSAACKDLLGCELPAVAVTNQLCASFYALPVYKVLRRGIAMPFVCFQRLH
jgi:hypothetical protein